MADIRYPTELQADQQTDYIEFYMVRRDYSSVSGAASTVATPEDREKFFYGPDRLLLNVPQRVVESHSQNWATAAFGEVTPTEVAKLLGSLDPSNFTNASNAASATTFNTALRYGEQLLLDAAASNLAKVGASNLNANGILSASGGIVYNPNMEILYNGPDFRRFNFQFGMFTKSKEDAKAIRKIVDWWKRASHPAKTILAAAAAQSGSESQRSVPNWRFNPNGQSNSNKPGWGFGDKSRFIIQPPLVVMTYKRGAYDHPFIQPLLPAAVTNLSIDYTPTGNYTVLDNIEEWDEATTVAVSISVSLTELRNIFLEDIEWWYTQKRSTLDSRAPRIN